LRLLRKYLAEGRLNTSAKMLAVLGFFCNLELTDPVIESLCLTAEGDVLARPKDRNRLFFLFRAQDLRRNLTGACEALAVPEEECRMLASAADRILAEGKLAADGSTPLSGYAIGCSQWSFQREPSSNSIRFCCKSKVNSSK
jgi:hypothetical protein